MRKRKLSIPVLKPPVAPPIATEHPSRPLHIVSGACVAPTAQVQTTREVSALAPSWEKTYKALQALYPLEVVRQGDQDGLLGLSNVPPEVLTPTQAMLADSAWLQHLEIVARLGFRVILNVAPRRHQDVAGTAATADQVAAHARRRIREARDAGVTLLALEAWEEAGNHGTSPDELAKTWEKCAEVALDEGLPYYTGAIRPDVGKDQTLWTRAVGKMSATTRDAIAGVGMHIYPKARSAGGTATLADLSTSIDAMLQEAKELLGREVIPVIDQCGIPSDWYATAQEWADAHVTLLEQVAARSGMYGPWPQSPVTVGVTATKVPALLDPALNATEYGKAFGARV